MTTTGLLQQHKDVQAPATQGPLQPRPPSTHPRAYFPAGLSCCFLYYYCYYERES